MKQTKRLFFALPLDEKLGSAAWKRSKELHDPQLYRLLPRENLHITLLFLGEQPCSILPELMAFQLQSPAIKIELAENSCMPPAGPARVFTIAARDAQIQGEQDGIQDGIGGLARLQQELASLCKIYEKRKFRPHVTVAYQRKKVPGTLLRDTWLKADYQKEESKISECILFESILGQGSAKHIALKTYFLGDSV